MRAHVYTQTALYEQKAVMCDSIHNIEIRI